MFLAECLIRKHKTFLINIKCDSSSNFKHSAAFCFFFIISMQSVYAETCAPDLSYILPKIPDLNNNIKNETRKPVEKIIEFSGIEGAIMNAESNIELARKQLSKLNNEEKQNLILNEEWLKQLNCRKNGGQIALSSAEFDENGNYKGSANQNSNSKSSQNNNSIDQSIHPNKNDKSGTPDIEVFFRGNTYFARVRPNSTYPADCTVEFNVTGQTYSAPNNVYLNDIAGNMFSEALGGNPQSEVNVSARATCTMSAAEQSRRETKEKQAALRHQFDKKKK